MAVLKYVGTPPQYDVRSTQSQDLADQAYVAFLLSQNMTTDQVNAQISAQLAQYATLSQANSAMADLATPSWIQSQVGDYVQSSAVNQPNGPVGLGSLSNLVDTSLINAPSTQTWPKPFWSPGTYPTASVSATTTPVQLLSMAIADPGYPYVLLCFGAFDTTVAADDGTSAQVAVYQGSPTGTLIAAGVGNSEYYTGPTPGDLSSQMFVNSASGIGGGWNIVPNWLPQNSNGYTSIVLGNYLQVPDTMTATVSASITFTGAAGSGAKGAAPVYTYIDIIDSNGTGYAQAGPDGAGSDTISVSWSGAVTYGQLFGVQAIENNAAAYATITAGTVTITPAQIPNTSAATVVPVSFTDQPPITGPTNIYAMLESSNSSTQVTATMLDPGLWVTPVPWAGGSPSTPVAFDNVGAGQFGGSATTHYSYSHDATIGAFVIVDVVVDRASSIGSITYGGTLMTLMTSTFFPGATGNGAIYRYYLANVAAGTKTVAITLNSGAWCASCSYSYLNVIGFTYSTTTVNSATTLTQTAAATTGQKVVQSFGCQPLGPTSPTGGTVRFNNGSHAYLLTQDSSSSATYTAAVASAQGYGGIATVLLP